MILVLYWMVNVENSFDLIGSHILFGLGGAGCGTAVVLGAVGRSVKSANREVISELLLR